MKTFLFEKIYFLSEKEKKGRVIKFHPRKNLVIGRNHTGKSSLIKNMFLALGARPQGKLELWDVATVSVVDFSIDYIKYRVVHQKGNRALFNHNGQLLLASNAHREWSDAFAKILDFNLVLPDKKADSVLADPQCFFLPFYINQDGSWLASWDTFVGLQQYKAPVTGILDYFTGIKPPKYYEFNSLKSQQLKKLDESQKEQKLLKRARERFGEALSLSGPKFSAENFELEISRLTSEVTELNKEQEMLRDSSVREQEMLHGIKLQIDLANNTLAAYEKDFTYLRKEDNGKLECPTCGTEHPDSFLGVLTYAEDARSLRELVDALAEDAHKIHKKHSETQQKLFGLEDNYQRVSNILNSRKGDFKFIDVVNSIGAESAFRVFEDEDAIIKAEIDKCLSELQTLNASLKALTDRNRSIDILNSFRAAYRSSLISLNLPLIETDKLKLASRPDMSGSGGPRSILAYYAALWSTCRSTYSAFSVPLVIESPNQQGQDDINLPLVLKFISEGLPANSQIILGTEINNSQIDTEQIFDNRIELEVPYGFLLKEEYELVNDFATPLVEHMFAEIKTNKYKEN